MNGIFSGGVSLARVNPVGIVLLILALVISLTAEQLGSGLGHTTPIRIGALLLGCLGAGIAILA